MNSRKTNEEDSSAVAELRKYVENLKGETARLRDVLNSKDQLIADKSNLNK